MVNIYKFRNRIEYVITLVKSFSIPRRQAYKINGVQESDNVDERGSRNFIPIKNDIIIITIDNDSNIYANWYGKEIRNESKKEILSSTR